jgi:hypothetical protein
VFEPAWHYQLDWRSLISSSFSAFYSTLKVDQVLLGLADVAQSRESGKNAEEVSTQSNNQSVFEDNEVASTEAFSLAQVETLENSNASSVSVTIEEEKTTTTETVVTSYKVSLH